jgi:hypothetical protein
VYNRCRIRPELNKAQLTRTRSMNLWSSLSFTTVQRAFSTLFKLSLSSTLLAICINHLLGTSSVKSSWWLPAHILRLFMLKFYSLPRTDWYCIYEIICAMERVSAAPEMIDDSRTTYNKIFDCCWPYDRQCSCISSDIYQFIPNC